MVLTCKDHPHMVQVTAAKSTHVSHYGEKLVAQEERSSLPSCRLHGLTYVRKIILFRKQGSLSLWVSVPISRLWSCPCSWSGLSGMQGEREAERPPRDAPTKPHPPKN